MTKTKVIYQCLECGFETAKYLGRCPECLSWNSMQEKMLQKPTASGKTPYGFSLAEVSFGEDYAKANQFQPKHAQLLSKVEDNAHLQNPYSSGFSELDRVLGQGILPGSYYLLGGDPGIGKSTLMLQMAAYLAKTGKRVLYVSGEESLIQLKNRAERIGLGDAPLNVLCNTQWEMIVGEIQALLPEVIVIDSIQAIYHSDFSGPPGSVGQIRDCAGLLMQVAKMLNITIFLIGHVTKEGVVAGPKLLEHTVDGVFYLEGDDTTALRILTGVKNRFGSTHEIGVFEMTEAGFAEIDNPSAWFLSERGQSLAGSSVLATVQGNRPLLVEIQALVSQSAYSSPVRNTNGFDRSRLHQIIAILEKRLGLDLNRYDIYINVVGGFKLQEPAADLAVALAVISSYRNQPLKQGLVVCGELGLTGELRPVQRLEHRLKEAQQLGFLQAMVPQTKQMPSPLEGFSAHAVESLYDVVRSCFEAPQNNK